MPRNGAFVFTEPGDLEASVDEANIELVVTGCGPFKAKLTRADLGQLHLLRFQEDLASVAYSALRVDLAFVAFPTRFDPPPVWGGEELRSGDIIFYGLGEHGHARTTGPSDKSFIVLKPEHLAFWSRALTGDEVVPPKFARIFRPSLATMPRLRYLHSSACDLVEKSPTTIAHPEVARAIEQELIHALITCLKPEAPLETRPIRSRRAAIMNRFEGVLAAHTDRPLHMRELCMAIGVSERTLRLYCADSLGMSPGRYLRLRQLRLTRAALRNPDSATTSVAEVARRYGFGELGRFAGMYRAVYGEAPSATLRLRRH